MCVAIPAEVVKIKGENAVVDFGGGTKKEVNISLVAAERGQFVLVHAGFAIQVIDEIAAQDTLKRMEKSV